MSDDRFHSEVRLDVSLGRAAKPSAARGDEPFRIVVFGDFGGRGTRPGELSGRRPILVDRDNFDDVLAALAPELWLDFGDEDGATIALRFSDLDDFHPDSIYARAPVFQALRLLRERLADPRSFKDAARELQRWAGVPAEASPTARSAGEIAEPAPSVPRPVPADLLERMLDEAAGPAPEPARRAPPDELRTLVRSIVAPHVIPDPDPRQPELIARADRMIGDQMRAILHHPEFRSLESVWRSLFLLVRHLDTDSRLQLYLVDVTRTELEADLALDRPLESTGLYRLLVEDAAGTIGSPGWALTVGLYTFGPEAEDVSLLTRVAEVAHAAGAPWISDADPRLTGFTSFETTPELADADAAPLGEWQAFREAPSARFVGLVSPRFLLRLPYGADGDPCDAFPFEELGSPPDHEAFLWGNAAVICALLLGRAFSTAGWAMRPGLVQDFGGLPFYLDRSSGTAVAKPCAETLMTERVAAHMLEAGIMPLASLKDTDAVRVVRFQSVAAPLAGLAGRWSGTHER